MNATGRSRHGLADQVVEVVGRGPAHGRVRASASRNRRPRRSGRGCAWRPPGRTSRSPGPSTPRPAHHARRQYAGWFHTERVLRIGEPVDEAGGDSRAQRHDAGPVAVRAGRQRTSGGPGKRSRHIAPRDTRSQAHERRDAAGGRAGDAAAFDQPPHGVDHRQQVEHPEDSRRLQLDRELVPGRCKRQRRRRRSRAAPVRPRRRRFAGVTRPAARRRW